MKHISVIILCLLISLSSTAQLDRSTAPKAGTATKIEIGEYKKFELKNGLKVILVENHKHPIVSYSISLDIDPVYEGEFAGYTSATGKLLRSGTTTRKKSELDKQIDFIGATLYTGSKSVYAKSLKKHSTTLLDLMSDVLYNPTFPEEELEKIKNQNLTGLKADKEDPDAISGNISTTLLYGKNTAYGEILTENTVENITIEKCKEYYDTYFRPNVAYLVIVGDITLKEAKKQAKKYFAAWESKEVPAHPFSIDNNDKGARYAMGNKDAAPQTVISVTYPINLKPGAQDILIAKVANQVLGGGSFSARLLKNLREDKAWTYGAYSSISADEFSGKFKASSKVRTAVTDSAFVEITKEMMTMRTELVDAEDLQLVKNSMAGSFGRSLEDASTIARFALNIDKYNLPTDYYDTYLERLEAITPEDVQKAAIKYITPEKAIYLAVGDVATIEPMMENIAQGKDVVQYDFYGDVVKKSDIPAGLTAEKVIENYLTAIGGEEKLSAIKDLTVNASTTMQGMTLSIVSRHMAPNRMLIETSMNGNVLSSQSFDGENGKVKTPMGEQILKGEMLEAMKYQSYIFPELTYATLRYKLELVGVEKLEDKKAYKVNVTNPVGKISTEYFCTKTGLKLKTVSSTPQGNTTTLIKEYKEVEGIMYPLEVNQSMGPQMIDVKVSSVKINTGIDESVFSN
ncbi:insulinase family protein [bacterium]|nr:insulinase family protein [bacterium]